MKVEIHNSRSNNFWIEVFEINYGSKKLIGQYRTVSEFKKTNPNSEIILNDSYDQG